MWKKLAAPASTARCCCGLSGTSCLLPRPWSPTAIGSTTPPSPDCGESATGRGLTWRRRIWSLKVWLFGIALCAVMCLFWTCVLLCVGYRQRVLCARMHYPRFWCCAQTLEAHAAAAAAAATRSTVTMQSKRCVIFQLKGASCSNRCLEMRTISYSTVVWVDGWVGGWRKGAGCFVFLGGRQQRALRNPLHLISVIQWHPLCVVYIHRIGSALHANKILLLIIGAAQKSANQPDEDNKAGWVARAPWVPTF